MNGVTAAIFGAFTRRGQKWQLRAWFDGFYDICELRTLRSGTRIVHYPDERGLGMLSAFINPWNDAKVCLVAGGSRALGTIGALYVFHLYLQSYLDPAHSSYKISSNATGSPVRIFDAASKSYGSAIRDENVLNPKEDIRNISEDLEGWTFHD